MENNPQKPYKDLLKEVKQIVEDLSSENIDVDEMVDKVEKGFAMITTMKDRLNQTKDKIEDLYKKYDVLGNDLQQDGNK